MGAITAASLITIAAIAAEASKTVMVAGAGLATKGIMAASVATATFSAASLFLPIVGGLLACVGVCSLLFYLMNKNTNTTTSYIPNNARGYAHLYPTVASNGLFYHHPTQVPVYTHYQRNNDPRHTHTHQHGNIDSNPNNHQHGGGHIHGHR